MRNGHSDHLNSSLRRKRNGYAVRPKYAEQLILFGNTDTLLENVEGQILPRIWAQGNTKCVVCKPNNEQLIALFYENNMDAKENYFYAKELDSLLKDIIK